MEPQGQGQAYAFPQSGLLVAVSVLVDMTSLRQPSLVVRVKASFSCIRREEKKRGSFGQCALFILTAEMKKQKTSKKTIKSLSLRGHELENLACPKALGRACTLQGHRCQGELSPGLKFSIGEQPTFSKAPIWCQTLSELMRKEQRTVAERILWF